MRIIRFFLRILNAIPKLIGRILKAIGILILVAIALIVLLAILLLRACSYNGYGGEHTDLYTVAVNNVFGLWGHCSNGEVSYDPVIEILETDEYGRVLFFYDEYYDDSIDPTIDYGMAFVIMQKSEDGYVYYYQDACYAPYFDTQDDFATVMERVDPTLLEELKARNDWNEELDESKCTAAKLQKKKPKGQLGMDKYDFNRVVYTYAKANGYQGNDKSTCQFFKYCNSDATGKELYYVYCMSADDDGNGGTVYGTYVYAIIVNPDESIPENAIVEIPDPTESYELIKALKEQAHWKQN